MIIIATTYLIEQLNHNEEDFKFEASGRANVDFRVFYLENETFQNNPVTSSLNFLISFTDFIEVESSLETSIISNQTSFFAELLIEFTYYINILTHNIREQVVRGYIIPLSLEVYSLVAIGQPTLNIELELPTSESNESQITLSTVIVFVLSFTLSIYFLLSGIKILIAEPNEILRERAYIFKKYGDEIVSSNVPLKSLFFSEQKQYTLIPVYKFENLINLAINSSETIISYQNDYVAEFAVVKDKNIYFYKLSDNVKNRAGDLPIEDDYKSI